MRQRSMSCGVRTKNTSDLEDELDYESDVVSNVAPKLEDTEDRNIKEILIEKVLASLPKNDEHTFAKRLKKIKWDQLGIQEYSAEQLQAKLIEIVKNVPKTRTLEEILHAAKHIYSSFDKHPDRPKKPANMFALFIEDKYAKYKEVHPDLPTSAIMKKLGEAFHQLSEKKLAKYKKKFEEIQQKYNEDIKKFLESHPDVKRSTRPSRRNQEKKASPFTLYWIDRAEELNQPESKIFVQAKKEWSELDMKRKAVYIKRYFEANETNTLTKTDKKQYFAAKGLPLKPQSAFSAFLSENQKKVKCENQRERMKLISEMWRNLDRKTKDKYKRQAEVNMEVYKQEKEKFMKSLTKEEKDLLENGTTRKRKVSENVNGEEVKSKKEKVEKFPEPVKPPETAFELYQQAKFPEDRKAAKKKWKSLKESKKAKYEKKLSEAQKEYFANLKTYLQSLSPRELKEYKERIKKEESSDESDTSSDEY